MDELIRKFRDFIEECGWFTTGDRLILACSGGVDSMGMTGLFQSVADPLDFTLVLAHVNHQLRGTADRDEQLVRDYAEEQGFQFHSKRVDVGRVMEETGESEEMVARRLRYQALEEIRSAESARWICTGHTANDQAETVLMRFLSGAGVSGLQGIRLRRGNILRPVLNFSRVEMIEFTKSRGIPWVKDETNADLTYQRNWIRHRLLPEVRDELNPNITGTLNRNAQILREVQELLDTLAENALKHLCIEGSDDQILLDIRGYRKYLTAVQKAIIYKVLEELNIPAETLTYSQTNQLHSLICTGNSGASMKLHKGGQVWRDRTQVLFTRREYRTDFQQPFRLHSTALPGYTVHVEHRDHVAPEDFRNTNEWIAWFDSGSITSRSLVWRTWEYGDRMVLFNGSTKKVSDIWIDTKTPVWEKQSRPLLAGEENVLWIPGTRRSGIGLVTKKSEQVVKLEVERKL